MSMLQEGSASRPQKSCRDHHQNLGDKLETIRDHPNLAEENRQTVHNPLDRAHAHLREPPRGAQIDAELWEEEQAMLKKKGK